MAERLLFCYDTGEELEVTPNDLYLIWKKNDNIHTTQRNFISLHLLFSCIDYFIAIIESQK